MQFVVVVCLHVTCRIADSLSIPKGCLISAADKVTRLTNDVQITPYLLSPGARQWGWIGGELCVALPSPRHKAGQWNGHQCIAWSSALASRSCQLIMWQSEQQQPASPARHTRSITHPWIDLLVVYSGTTCAAQVAFHRGSIYLVRSTNSKC